MNKTDKIYVAGHKGLVGSAIVRRLVKDGYTNIVVRDRTELDLTDQSQVRTFFEREKPDYVFFTAARVGGIFANTTYRADFIYENLIMQSNVIHSAFASEVTKLLFFGCADVYPINNWQSAKEENLLTGPLEFTCEPFALAKIAGIKMCESYNRQYGMDFVSVIPTNIYGPHQHYDVMNSQVVPALIKRLHDAKVANDTEIVLWGSGSPLRDFLFVDDLIEACWIIMNSDAADYLYNVGTGQGCSIYELAQIIKNAIGYDGEIIFDTSKPDGVPQKLLDVSRMKALGWEPKTPLLDGIKLSYASFLAEVEKKEIRTARICFIRATEKDINTTARLQQREAVTQYPQPDTYKGVVVIKPWGYEYLVFQNEQVAIWFLHIHKSYSTSLHSHPRKKTSLVLLSGTATSATFSGRYFLRGGDAITFDAGVFHSTRAISDDGVNLLEIETPPDKADLVRLEDRHGREMAGYEGITEMRTVDLQDYDYFYFEESDAHNKFNYSHNKFAVTFEIYSSNDEFQRHFRLDQNELCTLCHGQLTDHGGNILLDVGETQNADFLSALQGASTSGKLVILKTATKEK